MRLFSACLLILAQEVRFVPVPAPAGSPFTDPLLAPYIAELKKEAKPADLEYLTAMARDELILLHHGFGTGIRNKWLWGNRDPKLLAFFREKGYSHPDDMSMAMIEALWVDLNRNLSPVEREVIEGKRARVVRRRANIERLEAECQAWLKGSEREFAACQPPEKGKKKAGREIDPFYQLVVNAAGRVTSIVPFKNVSPAVQACRKKLIERHRFSAFGDDPTLTLYTMQFPYCRVAERDRLHEPQ